MYWISFVNFINIV